MVFKFMPKIKNMENNETKEDPLNRYLFFKNIANLLKTESELASIYKEQGEYGEMNPHIRGLVNLLNEYKVELAEFKEKLELDDLVSRTFGEKRPFLAKIGLKKINYDKLLEEFLEKCQALSKSVSEYANSIRPEKLGGPESKPQIVEILREYKKNENEMDIYKLKEIVDSLESVLDTISIEYLDEIFEIQTLIDDAAEDPSLEQSNLSKAKVIFSGLIPKIRKEWDIKREEIEPEEKFIPQLGTPEYKSILDIIKDIKETMEEETAKNVISQLKELTKKLDEFGLEEYATECKSYQLFLKKKYEATQPIETNDKKILREYLIEVEDDILSLMK